MTAHQVAHAIEEEARAFRRLRFKDAPSYLEAKDAHCTRIINLSRSLARAIGTPELLSIAPGQRRVGGRNIRVELRTRVPAKVAA
ncbi:hypothetical protein ASF58_23265 [Methylobacterium sp. Leaf125]|uniref:hypothetical protein n=1 Tax=Methylobacterium sp. Leaf125 TaxID=1736265 RepID=UPI0006F59A0C|nr:hypothetical protein [Methylobacterium sp. Leaf125]KQQ39063.1 hypothetical protein ASF58_23265 [Methylobacterium sp. Leaf125]